MSILHSLNNCNTYFLVQKPQPPLHPNYTTQYKINIRLLKTARGALYLLYIINQLGAYYYWQ